MGQLQLAVLGRPDIRHGDVGAVPLTSAKATALLAYLAITGEVHSRSALAGLLWGELPEDRARANLRTALANLRRHVGGHLHIAARTVGFDQASDHRLDRDELVAALGHGERHRLESAVAAYRGDLLTDLAVPGAPAFDEWLAAEREGLRRTAAAALRRLVTAASHEGDADAGLRHARRLLELDPYDEPTHRALMRLLAANGRRAAALAQFDTCRHVLAEDLGLDPSAETLALRHALLREPPSRAPAPAPEPASGRTLDRVGAQSPALEPDPRPEDPDPGALPVTDGPFMGREPELDRITQLLAGEHNVLVTLAGPGGAGKTRLALAAAERLRSTFPDGVVFLPLVGVPAGSSSAAAISSAIAAALRFDVSQRGAPHTQLARRLGSHRVLLVLDNLDHLDVAAWLTELLQEAPGVSVLATSRRRIGIGAEWVLDVGGLPVPDEDDVERVLASPAVRLFQDRAARIRRVPGPEHATDDLRSVAHLCRLVDGMPLALELASEWTRSLSVAEVAQRLAADLDLLVTRRADVPARHRSMRTVLDATWSMLAEDERQGLARLAVFRGGFDAAAAQAVAGTALGTLADLVDRCVVQRPRPDRFDLHELVRRYATERLNEDAAAAGEVARRHAAWCAALARRLNAGAGAADAAAWTALEHETANLRAAGTWASHSGSEEVLADLVDGLWELDSRRARFVEALDLLDLAVIRTGLPPHLLARWHHLAGTAAFELGRLERAVEGFDASLAAAGHPLPRTARARTVATATALVREGVHRVGPSRRPARRKAARAAAAETVDVLTMLIRTSYFLQRPEAMLLAALREAEAAERSGDAGALVTAYGELSHAAAASGRHRIARNYLRLADEAVPALAPDDPRVLNLELKGLSHVAFGEWDAASAAVDMARAAAARLGYQHRWEELQVTEGLVSLYRGRFAVARDQFVAGGRSARQRGDPLTLTWALLGEADAAGQLGGSDGLVDVLKEAVVLSDGLPAPERAKSRALLAWAFMLDGDRDGAAVAAVRAAVHYDTIRVPPVWYLEAATRLAQVWLTLWGNDPAAPPSVRRQAQQSVARLRAFARRYPVGVPRSEWARGRLALLEGRTRQAAHRWRVSLRAAEALDLPYDAGRAQFELARLLPAELPERDERLAHARAAFVASGARGDVVQVDAVLAGD